jgi:hypothetical protein
MRLGKSLAKALPDWNWRRLTLPHRWVGAHAGRSAELRMQPTFRSREHETEKMWSVSRERVPDIVLTVREPDTMRFVVLDAKYRAARANVLEAMESAHVYQDSLRIGSCRPEASLLLVPSAGGAPWLEDPTFQLEHRVGIHALSLDIEAKLPQVVIESVSG